MQPVLLPMPDIAALVLVVAAMLMVPVAAMAVVVVAIDMPSILSIYS